jgi:hypothetical protein
MDIKQAAQTIRDTVATEEIIRLYGYTTKRGFMVCPFHGDTDASLKVYRGTGGWHCFGCGRGGSVIDFVMEHENCDFRTAVRAIDSAMHLGLFPADENPYAAEDHKRIQQWLDDFADAIYAYLDALIRVIEAAQVEDYHRLKELEDIRFTDIQKLSADDWTFLLRWKDEDQYNNYRIEKINEFREEVAAWRRKARRAQSA